jgi:hypothetical protein
MGYNSLIYGSLTKMFQTFNFTHIKCCVEINNKETKGPPKKQKIMKDVNDDEVVLSAFGVVLEVNGKGGTFIKV